MGGKGGGKKGGGASGDIDVDVDSESTSSTVLDIVGLDDINIETTSTNRLEVPDPIQTRMEMALTEPIDTRLTLSVPETIRTNQQQRNEFAITEPIVTQTDLDVDVQPVVVDLCLTLGIKDLPRFCISRPYDRRFAVSLLGREVIGLDWSGSSQFIIDDVRPGGFLAGINQVPRGRQHEHHHHEHRHHTDDGPDEADEYKPRRGPAVRFVVG